MAAGRPTDCDKEIIPSVRDYIEKRCEAGRLTALYSAGELQMLDQALTNHTAKQHVLKGTVVTADMKAETACICKR